MVFTQCIPAQAASWRESSSLITRGKPNDLLYRTPPPSLQFTNAVTYARLRRLHRHGNGAIRQSIRGQPDNRHNATDGQYTTTDKLYGEIGRRPSTSTEQVSVTPDNITLQNNNIMTNKLKMEEFSDLSGLLPTEFSNIEFTGPTDELSTPVFDKGAFDFTPVASVKPDGKKTDLKVKVEYNAQYYSCDKNIYTDLTLATDNQVQNKGIFSISEVDNDMFLNQPYVHPVSHKDTLNDAYMAAFNGTSFSSNLSVNNIKNSNSTATSPQDDRYSYISSPADDQQMDISVPEHYEHSYDTKPKLNLMTEQFKFPFKQEGLSALNTPDVIDEVVNMGNDFNILDLVNNEDITIISTDEELLSSLISQTVSSSEPSTPSITSSKSSSPVKKSRRRKYLDEDDEDYLPPTKKQSTVRLADIDIENSSSDDSYYQPKKSARKAVAKPRGRPPKRGDSVSSDGSKDQDGSKYRELRDKNNEASRKSRLKRKIKEQEYEQEADELQMKNIRLKTQVEELEKMVSTFRNNLFKILVTK